MKKTAKRVFTAIISIIIILVVAVLAYLGYVVFSYSRIEDNLALTPEKGATLATAEIGVEYTIVTQNLGFGAYTADFTFFMDGGKESRAESEESVKACITAGAQKVASYSPDFVFFQEIDIDSTRSYHIDEREILDAYFSDYDSAFGVNYHSAYLFYPIFEPHGASNSGMKTYSKFSISSANRRSLPISTGVSKFLDLDRCYTTSRVATANGKELVLFNVHLSAYGGSDEIRSAQMNMLLGEMNEEYLKGNYVVCGGDFNHDFTGNSTQLLNGGEGEDVDFGWAQPFPAELFDTYTGIYRADEYTGGEVKPTCRNCDIPYEEGNFTIIVDGFLVSKNVEITWLSNEQTGFTYSDHSPVVMSFKLNG